MRSKILPFALGLILFFWSPVFSSPESDLFFKGTQTSLSQAEQEMIASHFNFSLSPDRDRFVDPLGKTIEIEIREVDLNDDEINEILIFAVNPYLYGITGRTAVLFIRIDENRFEANLDIPASEVEIMSHKTYGFKDLKLSGPGINSPVWCWNGKKYENSRYSDDPTVVSFKRAAAASVRNDPETILALAEELEKAAKGQTEKTVSILLSEFDVFYEDSIKKYWDTVASETYEQLDGELQKVGWQILESEGLPYLSSTGTWYQKRFKTILPADWKTYLDQHGKEIAEGFAEDATVIISWEKVRKRLEFWEQFQLENPDFPRKNTVETNIKSYACAFFGLFDNSSIDALSDDGEIDPEVKAAYEQFIKINQSSRYYPVLKNFYQELEKNSFIVTDELKEFPGSNGIGF